MLSNPQKKCILNMNWKPKPVLHSYIQTRIFIYCFLPTRARPAVRSTVLNDGASMKNHIWGFMVWVKSFPFLSILQSFPIFIVLGASSTKMQHKRLSKSLSLALRKIQNMDRNQLHHGYPGQTNCPAHTSPRYCPLYRTAQQAGTVGTIN